MGDDFDGDEDAQAENENRLELDYQLGEDIKEKIIPHAIDWFTGEALAFEEGFEDGDDGFEDDDLSDDPDNYDEDEEESDEEVRGHVRKDLNLPC